MDQLGMAARDGARLLANCSGEQRNSALRAAARSLLQHRDDILDANSTDMEAAAASGLGSAMLDRLKLDDARIESMAQGLRAIADLPDPIGRILADWERPNGLRIQRVAVPLGVIGIIYESRPNVTADAAGLCLKSGNAVILRGGSESFQSNQAIYQCLLEALGNTRVPPAAIQFVTTTDRDAVAYLLSSMSQYLDVVIPRGGKGLIQRVQQDARVPVIGHLEGICHVYLHESANTESARNITLNAKMRRTGICGAAETLLVDKSAAGRLLPAVLDALHNAGCEIRGDAQVQKIFPSAIGVTDGDWSTEYLDAIISVRVVDNIDAAIEHIREFGSAHTESIVAEDAAAAERFLAEVDSAIVLHNASTQFADGGEFGMGAEIGIATGRVHARGPVGAEQLTSYKYVVRGNGQVRP
ncbi:MAG: glutamate-5-semialdehyde dehydrogenase [Gammaproteobacteria bacterium]|nr:glutamate-5-semialdehyde dehydrogenase [Gammaproteobacteria bacterium]MDH5213404.1 glutamate-5-semialdehyde dehydrogenase [Gammaproteobacteria bacterium]